MRKVLLSEPYEEGAALVTPLSVHTFCVHAPSPSHFKAIKAKRKEAEKLPHFERVDCLTVSLAPFKAAVEDQLQRLSDALLLGLRRQAVAQQQELDRFIEPLHDDVTVSCLCIIYM